MKEAESSRKLAKILSLIVVGTLALAAASMAWSIDPNAPEIDLEQFHDHFSLSLYDYPRATAAPLGIAGFDFYVEATYGPHFDEPAYRHTVLDGSLPGGFLSVARVGVRKGLPGNLNVGASYGRVVGLGMNVLAAHLSWALNDGGLVTPTLAFRLTASKSQGNSDYQLNQYGLEAVLSKGFTVLTPYVGAGLVRSDGTFHRLTGDFSVNTTKPVLFAGATLHLLIPRLTVEVEKGESLQAAIRIGFGL
ncbi:MAG TPA: hypothetical protein VKA53_08610 [Thermoanaerobaculia bacterium]|nr:hypothetical protein [Thermoanaerobaculia bacterium]